jgi:hypothetical protein
MLIAFITLRMLFVLAWTIGNASCQSLHQVQFVFSMIYCTAIVTRCGTTEKAAMEPPVVLVSYLYHL